MPTEYCAFCGGGTVGWDPAKPRGGCATVDCPGNPEAKPIEDPRLLKAIHDAVVAEACRWRGIPKPTACGEFVRITDIWRYARVALAEVRKFEASPAAPIMRFRFHRGSLADSMATLREFRSDLEFRQAIEDWLEPGVHHAFPNPGVCRRTSIKPYGEGPDGRIGWPATFIVTVDDIPVGFADSDGSNLPMWT
jgi:hypothetical protein